MAGAPISLLADQRNEQLLVSYSLGEHGGYSPERVEEAGLLAFDLQTLERITFRLKRGKRGRVSFVSICCVVRPFRGRDGGVFGRPGGT